MADKIDLHVLPIRRRDGKDLTDLPGLFVAAAPRRAGRSRKDDILILHFVLTGTATISTEGQTQLLERLAQSYFNSSGAATSGLRACVEQVNQFLLERNLSSAGSGLQATGMISLVALHAGGIYLAQSGPNHALTVHAVAVQHLHNPALSGSGLGLGRSSPVYLTHTPLDPGDLVILTPDPPQAWLSESLAKAHGRTLETIQRVLLAAAGPDLNAVLIQARPGSGKFRISKRDQLKAAAGPALSAKPSVSEGFETSEPDGENAMSPAVKASSEVASSEVAGQPSAAPVPGSIVERSRALLGRAGQSRAGSIAASEASAPVSSGSKPSKRAAGGNIPPIGPLVLTGLRAIRTGLRRAGAWLRTAAGRMLPGNDLFTIPTQMMAFVAIAVPVLIVTVAGVVYLRRGRLQQYSDNMLQAEAAALNARGQTEAADLRLTWNAVLYYVDQAEEYQVTVETAGLRQEALGVLDPLDGIQRLEYRTILRTPLGESVRITRMAASDDEIYLLNEEGGNIIRAWLTGGGYEIDTSFRCGPGTYGSFLVGRLVDFSLLPRNHPLEARVLAMDANGIIVYCLLDQPPVAFALTTPDSNWGKPAALALDSGTLYVLDPQTNAVWVYTGADPSFTDRPHLFFDEQVPNLEAVIDLAIDLYDMYLLHADGHITKCVAGIVGQGTQCTDPYPYNDPRPGFTSGPQIPATVFSQLAFVPPPGPSIYLFDAERLAVYHFSLQLTFQSQYRPAIPPSRQPATAFAVSSSRVMLLAFENELFGAVLP